MLCWSRSSAPISPKPLYRGLSPVAPILHIESPTCSVVSHVSEGTYSGCIQLETVCHFDEFSKLSRLKVAIYLPHREITEWNFFRCTYVHTTRENSQSNPFRKRKRPSRLPTIIFHGLCCGASR